MLGSLPADFARPFSIGQQVIVRHRGSRELCDGKVVMVERDCCKIQFDNPDLGVDLVKYTDRMPANWLDNLPDSVRSSSLSYNVQNLLETEHIQNLEQSGNCEHTRNGVSISELPEKSTCDDSIQSSGFPDSDELELYITAFVQSSQSQASQIVDEVRQVISEGNDSQDGEAGTWNQATQLPSNLILNCIATILAIKRLADSRHPPANMVGVLERFTSMLRPICSENLAIYKDIEKHISINSQLLALMPTALGETCFPCN
uniref:Uncharacterized protein n=1 Tax=Arundo donax TaxID=35708 RepID=A0A0A9CNP1_ARUDO